MPATHDLVSADLASTNASVHLCFLRYRQGTDMHIVYKPYSVAHPSFFHPTFKLILERGNLKSSSRPRPWQFHTANFENRHCERVMFCLSGLIGTLMNPLREEMKSSFCTDDWRGIMKESMCVEKKTTKSLVEWNTFRIARMCLDCGSCWSYYLYKSILLGYNCAFTYLTHALEYWNA